MISIVCATNNKKILEEQLKKSLSIQNFKDYELIIIDTMENSYKSAADALNSCKGKICGEYILFTHHDVIMRNAYDLKKIIDNVMKLKKFGIVGVIGRNDKGDFVGNITNGVPEVKVSDKNINEPQEVQTVDEVIFIIKKDMFQRYPLLIENKTWHLYAVEYCLKMKELGEKIYVVPSEIYHKSAGASMNKYYYKELKRLCKIYKNKLKKINTTMGIWHTNKFLLFFDILKVKIIINLINFKKYIIKE